MEAARSKFFQRVYLSNEFHFRHLTQQLNSIQSLFRANPLYNTSEMPKIKLSAIIISFDYLSFYKDF